MRRIVVVELVLMLAAIAGAAALWRGGVRVDDYGPPVPGSAGFTTTYYAGPWIGGAVAAAGVALLALVDTIRRLRVDSRPSRSSS